MAKFRTTIIASILVCLLAVTLAGNTPDNDEATTQVSLPLSEAANPALRLPRQSPNTETSSNSAVVSSVPLTKVTFRAVNRRFPVRSKHPCRHHFRFQPLMRENVEIHYGNDMIVSTGENSDFQETVLHSEGQRIPGRWIRLHHHHHHDDDDSDSDDDEDEDRLKKIALKRYDFTRFDREKRLKNARFDREKRLRKRMKHFRGEEEEQQRKGGFMKRVRKFLDHYF